MSSVTVVAKVVAKREAIEPVKAELLKLVGPTRLEEGCIEYRLHQDCEDPAVFVFYENWESLACLEKHQDSLHFTAYAAAVDGLIAEKAVHKMTEQHCPEASR
jgi:quinol monooxygenase YgiN